ncbi:MAG: hypothetical protein ACI4LM_05415 [Anaerovoracaceae bacterium]
MNVKSVNSDSIRAYVLIAAFVAGAVILRETTVLHPAWLALILSLGRGLCYIAAFIVWGHSIRRRIVQMQARRLILGITALMILWFVFRTVKYSMRLWGPPVEQALDVRFMIDLGRHLWYMYYLPILFIPTLAVFMAYSMGRPLNYRVPPSITAVMLAIDCALAMLVLTNDLHEKVFYFTTPAMSEDDYGYGHGYFLIFAWISILVVMLLVILFVKCRILKKGRHILVPIAVLILMEMYALMYGNRSAFIRVILPDITAVLCVGNILFIETCIYSGFIGSNMRYGDIFSRIKGMSVRIMDLGYDTVLESADCEELPLDLIRAAESEPLMTDDGKVIHNTRIRGGHAVWTDDISDILTLRKNLELVRDELLEKNALLEKEYEEESKFRAIEEQNRLYDLLLTCTQDQIDSIRKLTIMFQESTDRDEKNRILAKITVLGSYIKRRKDFILSMEGSPDIPVAKLSEALAESYRSLRLMGIGGSRIVELGTEYAAGQILTYAYDFFEDTVEACIDDMTAIYTRAAKVGDVPRISIMIAGKPDLGLDGLIKKYPDVSVERDGDETQLYLPLTGDDRE